MGQTITKRLDNQIMDLLQTLADTLYLMNVEQSVEGAVSRLDCSSNGLGITYRTALNYASTDGTITASLLIEQLRPLVDSTTFTINGEALELIADCELVIFDLASELCPDPIIPIASPMASPDTGEQLLPLYCKTWVYGLLIAVALVLGCTFGSFFTCIFYICCRRHR